MTKLTHRCIVVDDEPLAVELIINHLKHFPAIEVCATTTDVTKALALVHSYKPTLLFLDIEMPNMTGLQLAGILKDPPEIILTTAYREYAVESYELEVLDYLVKPISLARFSQSIDKYFSRMEQKSKVEVMSEKDHIFLQSERKKVRVNFKDIQYIEGLYDYVKIHTDKGQILTKESIGNILILLPSRKFIRVHKSFVIPIDKVKAYSASHIELNEKVIPIGRAFKEGFLKEISHIS